MNVSNFIEVPFSNNEIFIVNVSPLTLNIARYYNQFFMRELCYSYIHLYHTSAVLRRCLLISTKHRNETYQEFKTKGNVFFLNLWGRALNSQKHDGNFKTASELRLFRPNAQCNANIFVLYIVLINCFSHIWTIVITTH